MGKAEFNYATRYDDNTETRLICSLLLALDALTARHAMTFLTFFVRVTFSTSLSMRIPMVFLKLL